MNLPNTDAVAGGGEVQPWQSYHTVYTNAKAGMDGVDKEKVQRTVYEMSKGSKYFENEQRKEAYMQKRIENLRGQAALLTASDIAHFEKVADRRVLELEAARDVSRIWVHVDMDAFYAAVETLENPSLAGKPMAVGSMSMICTANYEARKFGIRAAMPGFIARKLCPELIFVPTNFEKYSHYSELTRQVFREYDSRFIARSLDEAYLDITDVCRQRCMSGEKVADELREGIYFRTGLTCSAGVAPNRLLAKAPFLLWLEGSELQKLGPDKGQCNRTTKVCSDINKPNGQFVLPNERPAVMTFVSSLPIRKVSGIGKVTERMLKDALGINTCEDLLHKRALVCALFSRCSADFFLSVGLGLGGSEAPQEEHRKSISSERTFLATNNEVDLFEKLEDIADTLSNDMDKEGLRGRTLTLKLKTAAFEVRTRAVSLQLYIHSRADILHHASKLLKAELPLSLRLIGLRISQFKDDNSGLSDLTQKTLTSYINSGNVTREIGSPEKHPDAQNSVCYLTESDGRDKNDFSILENEMDAADAVHPHIADSPCKCYNPWFLVNCVSHGAYTVKHDITGRQNKVSEHIGSENFTENEQGSAKIENHHADFVSRVNLVEDGHLHQCGGQLHFKVEASTTAADQTECKHIDMDTNEKASYSNSLSSAGILQGTSRNLEFNLENNNDHIPNESSMKMSELELHGIFCADNMSKAKVDLQSEFSNIMFWIDDCCCSLCGAELPMDFIQERQEHYDYHLAQMLQQEESPSMNAEQENQQQTKRPRWSAEKPSRGRKHVGNKLVNSQKKRKHLPIDSFFIKSLHHS